MWKKVLRYEINGNYFNAIFSLYQNIKSCVTLNGSISPSFESCIGVRQGENLSPVLFSLFLNDLESYFETKSDAGVDFELEDEDLYYHIKFIVLLYADDKAILSESEDDFQTCLDHFVDYCKMWKLNINFEKTKIVIFGARNTDRYSFKMNGINIEIVKSYTYLGVTMSSNGSFLNARKSIYQKANKAMHLLYKRIYNLNLPIDLQLKLFDSTIIPIIAYGCEVWGYEDLQMFERIHNQFLRLVTKCRKSTPMYMLYGELDRYPIEIIIKSRLIGFWTRIITGNQSKLIYLVYQKLL